MKGWKEALGQVRGDKGVGVPSDYMISAVRGILKADLFGRLSPSEVDDLILRAAGYTCEYSALNNLEQLGFPTLRGDAVNFGGKGLVDLAWDKLEYFWDATQKMKAAYEEPLRDLRGYNSKVRAGMKEAPTEVPGYMKRTLTVILNRRVEDLQPELQHINEPLGDVLSDEDKEHLLMRIVGIEGKRLRWWEDFDIETGEYFQEGDVLPGSEDRFMELDAYDGT